MANNSAVTCNAELDVDAAGGGGRLLQHSAGDNKEVGEKLQGLLEITEPPGAGDEAPAAAERKAAMMHRVMAGYMKHLQERTHYHLGYPINMDYDFSPLAQLLNFSLNNAGDPFAEVNAGVHSRKFEAAVLDWFANLWELQRGQYWGYVTTGGTEGNLYGLLLGRELFPNGIMYASQDSHYSVFKAAKMYRVQCIKIDSMVSGEMNCADFKSKLLRNTKSPAIINVNIGTTLKGAVDNIDQIIRTLEECGFQNRYYIHCDAALSGIIIPFIKQGPKVSFKKPIGSISISGHKFLGCPMPCGVVITRLELAQVLSTDIEYIASRDATITGSRNGHAPIFLWYTLSRKGFRGILKEVQTCLRNARYLEALLKKIHVSASWNAASNIVVFERPRDERFVRRWQLACEGNLAHVVVMPNVTVEKITDFVEELAKRRSGWYQRNGLGMPCLAIDIGWENCRCSIHTSRG